MADLTLTTFNIHNGSDKGELPGFMAASAPRKSARSRQADQLISLLTLAGNAPLTADATKQMLIRMAEVYFNFSGSVTSALRAAADGANQYLLDRNLRNTTSGRQSIGLLNMAVLHSQSLYLANAGPVYSLTLRDGEKTVYHDPAGSGKGLGLSRTTSLRYYQADLKPGVSLLMSAEPAILNLGAGGIFLASEIQAAFFNHPASFTGALALVSDGSGKLTIAPAGAQAAQPGPALAAQIPLAPALEMEPDVRQPGASPPEASRSIEISPAPAPTSSHPTSAPLATVQRPPEVTPASSPESDLPAAAAEPARRPAEAPPAPAQVRDQPAITPTPLQRPPAAAPAPGAGSAAFPPAPVRRQEQPVPAPFEVPRPLPVEAAPPAAASHPAGGPSSESVLNAVARTVDTSRRVRQTSGRSLASFFSRLLPGESGQPASISPLTMAFVAVAVPVVVVAAALMVYFEKGRGQQYEAYYQQALQAAALTQGQTDPAMLRNAWSQTLYYLDKADAARPEESEAFTLRQQAQQALDGLDGITRLDYQPAILGGLAPEENITSMLVSGSDLFMLNDVKGRVERAILTGRGYEIDPNFTCEAGPYGGNIVSNLLDMAPMPRGNEFNASLMAIDAAGNLLFCKPGDTPISAPLGPPDNNWGKITAIAYDAGGLYILDPPNNAVWVYSAGESFRDRPSNYFGSSTPPLADAVDLAVNGEDLYLLFKDGHTTTCVTTYVGGYDTQCTDPATYSDPRPGREAAPVRLSDASFTQLRFLPPPDPSLYFLDSNSGAIYHFSLRLNLNRQLRALAAPTNPFPAGEATAFTVGSNHMAYVAFGSQVFYGLIQ